MNLYSELAEVGDIQNNVKNMTDNILDLYKINPKKCKKLLMELNEINKELDDLEKEFESLSNKLR
jgi:predicted  nucleic acid-binding Zn-ribbon protein